MTLSLVGNHLMYAPVDNDGMLSSSSFASHRLPKCKGQRLRAVDFRLQFARSRFRTITNRHSRVKSPQGVGQYVCSRGAYNGSGNAVLDGPEQPKPSSHGPLSLWLHVSLPTLKSLALLFSGPQDEALCHATALMASSCRTEAPSSLLPTKRGVDLMLMELACVKRTEEE